MLRQALFRLVSSHWESTFGGQIMLGRLVLLLLQITVGWFATNALMSQLPLGSFSQFKLFIFAVIAAIVVYLVGVIAAQVVKDVGSPSSQTLTSALIFALIAAALAKWLPSILPQLQVQRIPDNQLVMAGAVLGYMLKK
jgi:purine-cytosine permease-like protein